MVFAPPGNPYERLDSMRMDLGDDAYEDARNVLDTLMNTSSGLYNFQITKSLRTRRARVALKEDFVQRVDNALFLLERERLIRRRRSGAYCSNLMDNL